MDRFEAEREFGAVCPPNVDPKLTVDQVNRCLRKAQTVDADGVWPTEPGWTPTYDGNVGMLRAALEGWELKYGNAANRFPFTTDGQNFQRNKALDHIDARIAHFRRKLAASVGVS